MTQDRAREGDWNRTEWEGEGQDPGRDNPATDRTDATTGDRWNKGQWPGDQGHGEQPLKDPDTMPEGETGLSGDRHAPGEEHFARGQAAEDVS